MTLFDQVRQTVAVTLDVPMDSITQETSQENFALWDSVAHVNLVLALEQEFDIQLEVEEFNQLNSVAAIVAYLEGEAAA